MVVTFDFFFQHILLGHSRHAGDSIVLTYIAFCCFPFVVYIVSILHFNFCMAFSVLAGLNRSPVIADFVFFFLTLSWQMCGFVIVF